MKYMLLIMTQEKTGQTWPQEDDARLVQAHGRFYQELVAQKKFVSAGRLQPESAGARVTLRGGRQAVVDGPFAETKEVIGGFYLIEADSREEAIAWAAKCPSAERGPIEVRPLVGD